MIKIIKIEKPDKKLVGQRIRAVKEDFGLSLTELGMCLDLKKSTIQSYIQGYSLAPLEVVEKISSMTGKPVNWFYYGLINEEKKDFEGMKEAVAKREEVVIAYFEFVKIEIEKMKNSESKLTQSELAKYIELCISYRH